MPAAGVHDHVAVALIVGSNDGYKRAFVVIVHGWHLVVGPNGVLDDVHREDETVHGEPTWDGRWVRGWITTVIVDCNGDSSLRPRLSRGKVIWWLATLP